MDFVEVGRGTIRVGEVTDFLEPGNTAVHRIGEFKCDQLRRLRFRGSQLLFKVVIIILPPDDADELPSLGLSVSFIWL